MTLAYTRRHGVPLAPAFYLLALVQTVAALTALYLTAQDNIARAACMTGIIGAQMNMVVALALLGTVFAFLFGARQTMRAIMGSNKSLFAGFSVLQGVASLVLLPSALLCTV
ncbi:MAG: hypothetical protein LC667_01920 [Thioalkalivibrio sp.]|nr:hypothetical protein [Thioalkalivibrio sp.]